MVYFLLFVFNVIIKFYNAFAIHKAIGKQVSITKILLSGVFGIFSHTLIQLIAKDKNQITRQMTVILVTRYVMRR